MAGNPIDSLFFEIGLDASQVESVLKVVDEYVAGIAESFKEFVEGMQEGMKEGVQEAQAVAEGAGQAGDALRKMGTEGAVAGAVVAASASKAEKKVGLLARAGRSVGKWFGQRLRSVINSSFAPLFALFAGGAIVGGYSKDMARLGELQKKTALSTEELAEKQELLGMYSKEDQEVFRRLRQQMDGFTKQLKLGAAAVMHYAVPAMEWMGRTIKKVVDYVIEHKGLFIGVITAIAVAITAYLAPAIGATLLPLVVRLGTALKALAVFFTMTPLGLFILAITGLGLVLEDLWVYMNGGKSAFEKIWKWFGTTDDWFRWLKNTINYFKRVWDSAWRVISSVVGGAIDVLVKSFKAFISIFSGDKDKVIEAYKALAEAISDAVVSVFKNLAILIIDIMMSPIRLIGQKIEDTILAPLRKHMRGNLTQEGRDLVDSSGDANDFAKTYLANKEAAQRAASGNGAASVNNSRQVTVTMNGTQITAPSGDAAGISRGLTGALEKDMVKLGNNGV
jgi:phage-related protein